jgi:hypothetical protein
MLAGARGFFCVELRGDQPSLAIVRERGGDMDRRQSERCPELDDQLGPAQPHELIEQASDFRRDADKGEVEQAGDDAIVIRRSAFLELGARQRQHVSVAAFRLSIQAVERGGHPGGM